MLGNQLEGLGEIGLYQQIAFLERDAPRAEDGGGLGLKVSHREAPVRRVDNVGSQQRADIESIRG